MEGLPLPALASALGTPFFLFSEARLCANYRALERGLAGAGATLRYCAKTNHEAAVLRTLAECGSHLLASHAAEVELAVLCGFAPERIAFARPVLIPAELDAVLAAGVPLVHVHRPADLPLVEAAAARAGRRVRVSLRLRQDGLAVSPLDRLNRRLGFGGEEALEAVRRLRSSPWVEPWAVNFYLGTQQSSLSGFTRGFRRVLALLQRIAAETGVAIREVNLGGGIPSPSLRRLSPGRLLARWRDLPARLPSADAQEAFAARLAGRFREEVAAARLPEPPALAAEPGRSIVGGSGGAGDPRPGRERPVGVPGRQPELPAGVAAAVRPPHPAADRARERGRRAVLPSLGQHPEHARRARPAPPPAAARARAGPGALRRRRVLDLARQPLRRPAARGLHAPGGRRGAAGAPGRERRSPAPSHDPRGESIEVAR